MKQLRIALISDLHVGSKARGLDLCPHPLKDDEKVGRSSDYIAIFEKWASRSDAGSEGPIDFLCVTGDISNTADSEEFVLADKAILRIAKALSVSEDRIFFVPGNHDVHWPVMELTPSKFWSSFRYAPLFQEGLTFSRRVSKAAVGNLERPPYFVGWEHSDAVVIGINSAAYDGPSVKPHNGIIRQDTIEALEGYLHKLGPPDGRVRVCLLHHHIEQYSENIPDTADHSIAVNAENLVKVLSAHRIDILLHGHKHYPRLGTKQPDNQHPFVSICAGSFSSILPPLYYEGIPNLFHVITIEGRDNSTERIFGRVDSWSFQSAHWRHGIGVQGMYAREAFGSAATPAEVKAMIASSLSSRLRASPVCRWQDVTEDYPRLQNVRTEVAYRLFKEASGEVGCDFAGDHQVADKNWVAFRRQP